MGKAKVAPATKVRKRRKPMTAEQRAAASERLAKAREARMAKNPPQHKSIHPAVLALKEDDVFYFRKVQKWIKTQKEMLASARSDLRKSVKGAEARVANHQAYIRNLEKFLRDGDYVDGFYGEHQEHKIKMRCVVPAYDRDGNVKRAFGVYYADLGTVYIGEGINE